MTITSLATETTITGDGSATAFAIPFDFFGPDELEVRQVTIATGEYVVLTRGVHYAVTGGQGGQGTVSAFTAPAATVRWWIRRKTALTQTLDLNNADPFPADSVEEMNDRTVAMVQELRRDHDQGMAESIRVPEGESVARLPAAADRANTVLFFDEAGAPELRAVVGDMIVGPAGPEGPPGSGLPVGALAPYAGPTAPEGWLFCYGQTVNRLEYPSLFAVLGTSFNTGGESVLEFRLPDLRGRSVFGRDNMGGTYAGRVSSDVSGIAGDTLGAVGGSQSLPTHTHGVTDPGHSHAVTVTTAGAHSHSMPYEGNRFVRVGDGAGPVALQTGAGFPVYDYGGTTDSAGSHSHGATATGATTGISITSTGDGGGQNMPPAMILHWIIKVEDTEGGDPAPDGVPDGSGMQVWATRALAATAAGLGIIPSGVTAVLTCGYSTAGDGGAATYFWRSGTPSHALYFADASARGGSWEIAGNRIPVAAAGAVGDGTTNDRAAINAALTCASVKGGGEVLLDAKPYLASGGAISVAENVHLRGAPAGTGEQYWSTSPGKRTDFRGMPYALYVDGGTLATRSLCSIQGVAVIKSGIPLAATAGAAITEIRTWTGNGITIGATVFNEGNDVTIRDCFILGFGQAIYSDSNERLRIEKVFADCIAGIWIDGSADTTVVERCHMWPFYTAHLSVLAPSYAVSGAADNGSGLVRLTIATHDIQTGHIVHVAGVGGVTGAIGRFTATRISSTQIDLQGSTFGGAYTSGGTVYFSESQIRQGVAFRAESVSGTGTDWVQFINCTSFGFFEGYRIGNTASDITITGMGADNNIAYQDLATIGVNITGTAARVRISGGTISSSGRPVVVNGSNTDAHEIHNVNIAGHTNAPYAIEIVNGALAVYGGRITPERAYIWDAGEQLLLVGPQIYGSTFAIAGQSNAARQRCLLVAPRNSSQETVAALRGGTAALGVQDSSGVFNDALYVEQGGAVNIGPRTTAYSFVPTARTRPVPGTATTGDAGYYDATLINSALALITGSRMRTEITSNTAGAETTVWTLSTRVTGTLTEHFRATANRVTFAAVPVVPTYTVATVPSAGTNARGVIYVSDETGGAVLAFSDGTNWRRVTDRAVVS